MVKRIGDKKVSDIGLGTWKMGGGYWTPDTTKDEEDVRAIRFALENGINLIDTAEMYGGGHTEELVSMAINGLDREEIFIITKVWSNHLKYDDLIKSAMQSLKRLNSKYIDLYLIHWPNTSVPIAESIKAMEKLVDMGVIRYFGVSNFTVKLLEEARSATSKYEIIANEIEYSVMNKSPEKDLIPYCEKNKIIVIAYSPLGKGNVSKLTILESIAKKYNKTAVQVALNYLIKRSIPIPKASKIEHIKEILGSMGWYLTEEDYNRISKTAKF